MDHKIMGRKKEKRYWLIFSLDPDLNTRISLYLKKITLNPNLDTVKIK